MINRTSIFPIMAAMAILASCGPKAVTSVRPVSDDQPDGGAYSERTVPVVTKVAPDGEVTLRFYNDLPDVAYISAADFQSIVLPGSTMVVTHTGVGEYTLDNAGAKAVVNVNKDVFVSSDFDSFTNMMGLLQPGMANVYYDGLPFVRYKSIKYTPSTATVTLDFAKYGIDIRSDGKGAVYFPFATLADMYSDLFYHHAGFNGEKVVANTSVNEISLARIDPEYNTVLLSKKTRSASMAEFAYKELCFAMDHFYGYPGRVALNETLKAKGMDRTLEEDLAAGKTIKKLLKSTDMAEYLVGMTGLNALYYDGHTSMDISSAMGRDRSKYESLISEIRRLQETNKDVMDAVAAGRGTMGGRYQDVMAVRQQRPECYGTQDTYIKRGNTAVCVFNSFNTRAENAWNAYYDGKGPKPNIDDNKGDSMVIFLDALNKAEADPEVENFIVDITSNGGGSADIVMAMTSLIMNKSYLSYDNPLTGQRSIVEYEVDRNFDGVFDEKDKDVKYNLNFAVLSSDVSFSCGNLFPSMLKDAGIPVVGEISGGGSCAIQAMCTADGFCFQISSFRSRLNTLDGTNIDGGVAPTIPIATEPRVEIEGPNNTKMTVKDYKAFYDIEKIGKLVKEKAK
ncbi:MAG: hypothetical protein IJ840_04650 [Bacteroidales bacterium]|nr:hypothetical protein [Bacteroidales bacterium]